MNSDGFFFFCIVCSDDVRTCSIIGGGVVIVGLYMLLWGKEKDDQEEHGSTGKEREQLEMDCEKQAKKVSDVYEAPNPIKRTK